MVVMPSFLFSSFASRVFTASTERSVCISYSSCWHKPHMKLINDVAINVTKHTIYWSIQRKDTKAVNHCAEYIVYMAATLAVKSYSQAVSFCTVSQVTIIWLSQDAGIIKYKKAKRCIWLYMETNLKVSSIARFGCCKKSPAIWHKLLDLP